MPKMPKNNIKVLQNLNHFSCNYFEMKSWDDGDMILFLILAEFSYALHTWKIRNYDDIFIF